MPAVSALNSVDPCNLITNQELQQWGISSPKKPFKGIREVGCQWDGAPRSVEVSKADRSLDFFDQKADTFINYTRNLVNGRPGARLQGSPTNTECSEVMAVGTGYVLVGMYYNIPAHAPPGYRDPPDPCGEALAIATTIEPRLPK